MIGRGSFAWLAGFWDGEGSVGLTLDKTHYVGSAGNAEILVAQLSHTDRPSVVVVLRMLRRMGILAGGRGYTYQERNPAKHRDAHQVGKLARTLLPYAVTKRRHWELALEWIDRRVAAAGGLDAKGHIKRGGHARQPYGERDLRIVFELSELNRRGPLSRPPVDYGRIVE